MKNKRMKNKIQFDIITIFPKIFDSYFNESIIKRAQQKKLVKINIHNLRDYTNDKHKSACLPKPWRRQVDDKPYGGGPGMILKIEPVYKAICSILRNPKSEIRNPKQVSKSKFSKSKTRIILFSAKGKKFDQKMAKRFAELDRLIMICGRYEGVDERVAKYIADEEVSVGDYILTGGEIPAMIVVDAVTRLIPGVIAKESLAEESFSLKKEKELREENYEYPQYTRPEIFIPDKKRKACPSKYAKHFWRVPKILLSGDHKKIKEWRKK